MGIQHSCYVFYGVQIEKLDDETFWRIVDDQAEKVTDKVRLVTAGRYDNDDFFLVVQTHNLFDPIAAPEDLRPGIPFLVEPYSGTDEPYLEWDAELVAAAEILKAKTIRNPGWLFVPDES